MGRSGNKAGRRIYKVTKNGTEALKSGLQTLVKRKVLVDDLGYLFDTGASEGHFPHFLFEYANLAKSNSVRIFC
jgi:hypothetical protein